MCKLSLICIQYEYTMNFSSHISDLENELLRFKRQQDITKALWNDKVQQRFYSEFVEDIPKEFNRYIEELEALDKIFNII